MCADARGAPAAALAASRALAHAGSATLLNCVEAMHSAALRELGASVAHPLQSSELARDSLSALIDIVETGASSQEASFAAMARAVVLSLKSARSVETPQHGSRWQPLAVTPTPVTFSERWIPIVVRILSKRSDGAEMGAQVLAEGLLREILRNYPPEAVLVTLEIAKSPFSLPIRGHALLFQVSPSK